MIGALHILKCVMKAAINMVELQDRVLAPWGPSSISAIAELVDLRNQF